MHRHGTTTTETTTGHHDKSQKGNKLATLMAAPWVLLNMLIFAVLIGLASNIINSFFSSGGAIGVSADIVHVVLVLFTLLAASVGLATMIMAAVHGGKSRNSGAKFSSLSSNLISFALVMLAFGFACKAISRGSSSSTSLALQLRAIAALDIIVGATMLAYLFTLGLFKSHDDDTHDRHHHQTTVDTHPGTVAMGPKTVGGHDTRAPAV